MNFGRRWRVPKLVLAIPGSAEFLARAPGVWQKRTAIIKARSPLSPLLPCPACSRLSSPLLSSPLRSPLFSPLSSPLFSPLLSSCHPASSRLVSSRLSSSLASCCCRARARARSLTRSLARSLGPASPGGGTLLSNCHTLGIGKGRPRRCAQARGSNGKKSAGLTTGDGRRIDRANIGDRESAERVYGYNRDAATVTGYTRLRPRVNDAPRRQILENSIICLSML